MTDVSVAWMDRLMFGNDRINHLKMLGLVLMWASFLLALSLPALGIRQLKMNAAWVVPDQESLPKSVLPADFKQSEPQGVSVWGVCIASGSIGLLLWLVTPAQSGRRRSRR